MATRMTPPAAKPAAPKAGAKGGGLGQKLGPLTVGQWLLVAGALAAAFYLWRKHQAAAADTSAPAADSTTGAADGLGASGGIGGSAGDGLGAGPSPGPGLTYPQPVFIGGGDTQSGDGLTFGAVPQEGTYKAQPIDQSSPFFNPPGTSSAVPYDPGFNQPGFYQAPGGGSILDSFGLHNPPGTADALAAQNPYYTPSLSDYASEQPGFVRTLAYTGADPSKFFTVDNTQLGTGPVRDAAYKASHPGERYDLSGRIIA